MTLAQAATNRKQVTVMLYTADEVTQFVNEEDVKFIRLAFCDVFGCQKNISIMPDELARVFKYGAAIDGSAIAGFGVGARSDLLLRPDPSTLAILPWRPEHGRVVRMFCDVTYPDGRAFECDARSVLRQAISDARRAGYEFAFGSEMEFYLFKLDERGEPTREPYDHAGYMDIAPDDRGENVRREICLTLERMGIRPESSHHEEGPGQNEIDFRYSDALTAADNAVTFCSVVKTIAARSGLCADFSPKPLADMPGSGLHINMSVMGDDGTKLPHLIAGVLEHVVDMTAFLNPLDASYARLGSCKAPRYLSWSSENRSQLIRVPAALGEYRRAELRSPDPSANQYIAFTLLIYAALDGITRKLPLTDPIDENLFCASEDTLSRLRQLPHTRAEAVKAARKSEFIAAHLPRPLIDAYCNN